MKIHKDHLYHGAALIQIAEDESFTAINQAKVSGKKAENAYIINNNICVYMKYNATNPRGPHKEYPVNFKQNQFDEMQRLHSLCEGNLYIAMVCVDAEEICCISYDELMTLIKERFESNNKIAEDQYNIIVTAPTRKPFKVYINHAHSRGWKTETTFSIPRNAFPSRIF